jgi:signal transduction histidine kinase
MVDQRVHDKQLALLFASLPFAMVATLMVAGVVGIVFWNIVPNPALVAWCLAITSVTIFRGGLYFSYRGRSQVPGASFPWMNWFFYSLVVQAFLYSSANWLIYPDEPTYQLLLIIIMIGVASGGAITLAAHLPSVVMFVSVLLTPLAIRFLLDDDLPWLFGAMTIVYAGLLISTSRNLTHFIRQTFFLQQENETAIAELTDSRQALVEAMEEARSANRAKSEFLANMSHELRTPLNAVLGFSEVLQKERYGPVGNTKYIEYAGDIHRAGAHLLELINEVLDLSKIEAGQLELNLDMVDVNRTIETTLRMIRDRAFENEVELVVELEALSPIILADERVLKQVVLNLLANAVKFTDAGGRVTITSIIDFEGGVSIMVSDTGIGIEQADIARVLEPFAQVVFADNRAREGTGLGLPLSKRLIELHAGELEISSEIGVGTRVAIKFPPGSRIGKDEMAVLSS